jgi:hypothetical protein
MDQPGQDKQEHKRQVKLNNNKEYWEKPAEQIAEQIKQKQKSECGQMVCRQHMAEHKRTTKHKIQLESTTKNPNKNGREMLDLIPANQIRVNSN